MPDLLNILKRNFISPVVVAILILATILLYLGENRDAWFISFVIIVNTLLATVQEIRAMRALKKLELISAPRARKHLADGSVEEVMFDELQVGDVIDIQAGDEVPADAVVTNSKGLECDEGMLTGESAAVVKANEDKVYAATTVVAGMGTARVEAAGEFSKAGAMSKRLKRYSPQLTPIQKALSRAISVMTIGAIVLAAIILVVYYFSGQDATQIFKTITSAAITVIPEGLLLASTLLLALGSLKLTQAKVLPQKLSAIEAMALIDVLCVDKTGTLTSPDIYFDKLEFFDKKDNTDQVREQIGILAFETSSGNNTGSAIEKVLYKDDNYEVLDSLSFTSERKISGVRLSINNVISTLIMGAPEYVSKLAPLSGYHQQMVDTATAEGHRVLVVALFDDHITPVRELTNNSTGRPIALLILTNSLRADTSKTIEYLQQKNVSMRVLSGDNPSTVQYIAAKAGIKNFDKVITGAELAELDDSSWDEAIASHTIFARVLPEQKERIIITFQSTGAFTGMVGDGVNDALALKQADLGVAMYAGAVASRRVSDIILLDNSFTSLPIGMKLGDRIMQAIEIIASLFFHKIIYGVVLLLATLILNLVYPFEPRHVTFMNIFLVTLPTILLTFFPPSPQGRINPKYFWKDTLKYIFPIALLSGLAVTYTYWYLHQALLNDARGIATSTVIVATLFGVYMTILAPIMLNVAYDKSARVARFIYMFAVALVAATSFGFGILRNFFDFTSPAWISSWLLVSVIIGVMLLQLLIARYAGAIIAKRSSV